MHIHSSQKEKVFCVIEVENCRGKPAIVVKALEVCGIYSPRKFVCAVCVFFKNLNQDNQIARALQEALGMVE